MTITFERAYTPVVLAVMTKEALEWVTPVRFGNLPLDVAGYNRLHPRFPQGRLLIHAGPELLQTLNTVDHQNPNLATSNRDLQVVSLMVQVLNELACPRAWQPVSQLDPIRCPTRRRFEEGCPALDCASRVR